jgi:hypothetical protein
MAKAGDKIVFTASPNPSKPKHSTRFDFDKVESTTVVGFDGTKFKPSFYVPNAFGEGAREVRITIEVIR